jgi:sirohydrochlorin ferrochelatase
MVEPLKTSLEIYLVDNGSLSPRATLELRRLAEMLSLRSGQVVQAVSLLHSHKVPADQLDGCPATIVKRKMRAAIAAGKRNFILVPLFLGPSLAIVDYLPQLIAEFRVNLPDLNVQIAAPLCGENPDQPDDRLARILKANVLATAEGASLNRLKVALVDHGTPAKSVNLLRNRVASQLAAMLATEVVACSMERREGSEYDYNEPLLERVDRLPSFGGGDLIVAMFFLLPGRHAGDGGDVSEIMQHLVARRAYGSAKMSPLLGEHPLLLEILKDRLDASIHAMQATALV